MNDLLPPLNALRAFEAAARHENMTQAAHELHVTHGAVSRQVRALESQLGVALFHRRGRGLALTPAGLRLRDAAAAAFAQLRATCAVLRQAPADAPLVLGCPGSLLARWVIPRLERMQQDLPDLPVHLSAQETPLPTRLGPLDAALLLGTPPWPDNWQVHVLAPERIGPVLSPRYAGWPALREQPARCLLDEPVLHTASRPQAWADWARSSGLPRAPRPGGQDFAHLYQMLEAAIAGLGVAIAPAPLVREELDSGRLLSPWGFRTTQAHWVLVSPRGRRDARVDRLGAWLEAMLEGG